MSPLRAKHRNANLENDIDKALLLVLFPFFTVVLVIGFICYYARGGRPIHVKLKGLGVSFELRGDSKEITDDSVF